MAIALTTPQAGEFGFIVNGVSADASGCEELVAAVSGKSIVVDHLTINVGAALTLTVGQGKTGAAVTAALIGPLSMAENTSIQWDFTTRGGMALAPETALTVDTSGAGNVCVFATGRIE